MGSQRPERGQSWVWIQWSWGLGPSGLPTGRQRGQPPSLEGKCPLSHGDAGDRWAGWVHKDTHTHTHHDNCREETNPVVNRLWPRKITFQA